MPEFLELLPPSDALRVLLQNLSPVVLSETIDAQQALGRVTAEPVYAPHPLPTFTRSTVDGFALRARDSHGASDALPAYLSLAGEVPMGTAAGFSLKSGECALIHTGGMLPEDADAVVMVEHTQRVSSGEIEVFRAVATGDNLIRTGEDVDTGDLVIPGGTRLRPAEIGGLMALGITRVLVARKPRVGILSSGDEVIPPEAPLEPGKVHDVNAYTLSALVEQAGGEPVIFGIIPDQAELMESNANQALEACSVVVITAGSSASSRDLTAEVINRLGQPGVLVHGVNVRPGKPTILAACRGKAVIGLPGNPVSALVIASLFVVPVIERSLGLEVDTFQPAVSAKLSINLPSQAGREDWVPVKIRSAADETLAEPIFGKSNLIFTLARADGLICIPPDATGLPAGAAVVVWLMR
jgi:molybdopterin molybdotransferase